MSEQVSDATVNKIVNNLSWVNATLLAAAMTNTINTDFSNVGPLYDDANNAWIFFFVIFGIGIILAGIPRIFEDLDEMKRELELQNAEKKTAKCLVQQTKNKESIKSESSISMLSVARIYNFVEAEANDLVEKFEDLFVATLSNTVSIAWRD